MLILKRHLGIVPTEGWIYQISDDKISLVPSSH